MPFIYVQIPSDKFMQQFSKGTYQTVNYCNKVLKEFKSSQDKKAYVQDAFVFKQNEDPDNLCSILEQCIKQKTILLSYKKNLQEKVFVSGILVQSFTAWDLNKLIMLFAIVQFFRTKKSTKGNPHGLFQGTFRFYASILSQIKGKEQKIIKKEKQKGKEQKIIQLKHLKVRKLIQLVRLKYKNIGLKSQEEPLRKKQGILLTKKEIIMRIEKVKRRICPILKAIYILKVDILIQMLNIQGDLDELKIQNFHVKLFGQPKKSEILKLSRQQQNNDFASINKHIEIHDENSQSHPQKDSKNQYSENSPMESEPEEGVISDEHIMSPFVHRLDVKQKPTNMKTGQKTNMGTGQPYKQQIFSVLSL